MSLNLRERDRVLDSSSSPGTRFANHSRRFPNHTSLNLIFMLFDRPLIVFFGSQVLEWPSPVLTDKGPVEGPTINSVAMDPELRYLVALTDKNMVVVWKRADL